MIDRQQTLGPSLVRTDASDLQLGMLAVRSTDRLQFFTEGVTHRVELYRAVIDDALVASESTDLVCAAHTTMPDVRACCACLPDRA